MKQNYTVFQTLLVAIVASVLTLVTAWYVISAGMLPVKDDKKTSQMEQRSEIIANNIIPDVVESTIPAVVSISISADVPVYEQYYENFWSPFGGFFGGGNVQVPRQRQVGTERQEIGGGTGFIVSADGYIVTNKHVVDQEGVEYTAITNNGAEYEVEVVAKDPSLDVAILKIESEEDFPFLEFAEIEDVRLGETVIAIGNALAEFPNSVSVGVVSGLSRDIVAGDGFRFRESLEGVIQTDAAINRGNSGGPLLNTDGKVVGVNVAVAGDGENIGFALPGNVVASVFASVAEYGEIIRPFLGVRYVEITKELADRNNLNVDYGVVIVRGEERGDLAVIPGSPADKAGLEENDIIFEIDGEKLDGTRSLPAILRDYSVGDTITLQILHDGDEKEVSVTLEKQ